MSNSTIKAIIDGAFADCTSPSIGLSGGEAFYYLDDLLEIATYATSKGARVAINTNCFWASDPHDAVRIVRLLQAAHVTKLVASTDTYHTQFIDDSSVVNAIQACVSEHLEIEVQYVASKRTSRLYEFLSRNADALTNVTCREIPCHPVGRAEKMSASALLVRSGVPTGRCPNAVLSVSADGRFIPCCNSAGHVPALELGKVGDDQTEVFSKFIHSPTMAYLWEIGPAGLIAAAQEAGFRKAPLGYVDQCHLCFDLFKEEKTATAIQAEARRWAFEQVYRRYLANLEASC